MCNSVQRQMAAYDEQKAQALASTMNIPYVAAVLLCQRGIDSAEAVESFFMPTLAMLPDPYLMKGVREAAGLIHQALVDERPFIIYGDYDVDGTTAAATLGIFLKKAGAGQLFFCQPLRLTEGYGLHVNTVQRCVPQPILTQKPLLISVDCGISDHKEVRELNELGVEVIVTDHHKPPEVLPDAAVLINPLQAGCGFPEKILAGVGVAFYLVIGIRKYLNENGYFSDTCASPNLKEFLDLVAIGTVADMVPLVGVNRVLVKAGLEVLSGTKRPGLVELLKVSGSVNGAVCPEDIGYRIGPRINAAGRLGDAGRALQLLLAEDGATARKLALILDGENEKRKTIINGVVGEAILEAQAEVAAGRNVLVLAGANWHQGVIGIAAAKLLDQFHLPVLLFAHNNGLLKGSGRSVAGINLHELLLPFADNFISFGGHEAAVGIAMDESRLDRLKEFLDAALAAPAMQMALKPKQTVSWAVENGEIFDKEFLAVYERLEPFGMGNPEPLFFIKGELGYPREVGVNHLKFSWKVNGAIYEGIGFDQADRLPRMENTMVEMAFYLRRNTFRGSRHWQINAAHVSHITD